MRPRILGLILVALFGVAASPALAQDFRGSIAGTVMDTTGGLLPGVTVTVRNLDTNVSADVVTDGKGYYDVRYLNPGTYSVGTQLAGFTSVVRKGIEVRVGDVLTVDLTLSPGGVEETVDVTATTPVLDTKSGVTGQVIDSQQIRQLPLADGTAYMLSRLAPGVMDTSDLHFARPMDNAGLGSVVTNGVRGGNDFTLDGAPNIVSTQRIGFSPPSDAIAEFKVQTNAFDAQQGHTAGAVINLALRSGGNAFHGAAGYFNRDSSRSENSVFAERAGQSVTSRSYNRYTGTLSGPIVKDKTFFMASFEGLKDLAGEPAYYTVPTDRMRRGDFSELLALGIRIYDPLTGTSSRTQFPGNIIPPDRLDPIAMKVLSFYPAPNQAGRADLTNNFFSTQDRTYDYKGGLLRLDHNINGRHKLFLSAYWNKRSEDRYNWAGEVNGFAVTQGTDLRSNTGGTLGYTATLSSNLLADVRVSYSKFGEWRENADTLDPASLGFSSSTVSLMRGYDYLPRFDISGFTTLGSQRSDYSGRPIDQPFTNISFAPTVTWMRGSHSIRGGYDLRVQGWNRTPASLDGGRYNFTGAYTRQNNSAAIQQGQALAQFLLGIPTSGGNSYIDNNTSGEFRQISHALFVQDDWRLSRRLTVNVGLRLEVDQGMTEKDNRNIAGFDLTAVSPIAPAAQAAYAARPIPEIAPSDFAVRGGLRFADGAVYNTLVKPLPRGALSYLLNDKTVLRAGVGLFSFPYFFDATNQTGFSQQTLLVSTDNNGQTFIANLQNPFPSGLQQAPGSSQGLLTSVGRDLVSTTANIIQPDRKSSYYTRWQVGLQRDLGRGWMVEAEYVGSVGRNLPVRKDINALPAQYVAPAGLRNSTQESYLSANVPNPFAGLLPGTSFNGSTIQRGQLVRAFPEFGRVAIEEYTGSDSYHAGQLKVEKRFAKGNSLLATYVYSRMRDRTNYLNPSDTELEDRISPDDRPHRATVGAVLQAPFGHGRKWGSNWSNGLDAVLGGWQLSVSYQFQKGNPVLWCTSVSGNLCAFNNYYFDPNIDPSSIHAQQPGKKLPGGHIVGLDTPAWDTSGFYPADAPGSIADPRISVSDRQLRTFPTTLANVRNDDLHLMDLGLYKNFSLPRDVKLQIRIEAINALNYTVYFAPDVNPRSATFGLFQNQRNNPRDIQIGARLTF